MSPLTGGDWEARANEYWNNWHRSARNAGVEQFAKEEAQRENARLREALAFYADSDNYDDEGAPGEWLTIPSNPSNGGEEYDFEPDMGERARAALASRAKGEHDG